MTTKLVLENIKHKPMRSLLSILLIGVPVTLILSLVGLSDGLLQDTKDRARGVGADIIIRGSTVSSAMSFSSASIPEGIVALVRKQPHVVLATGIVSHVVDFPLNIMGIDLAGFDKMSGGFTYLRGTPLKGPDDILIDKYYAVQRHKDVGDTLTLLKHDWHVVGIIDGGKLARIVVQKPVLQYLDSVTGQNSVIYVKLDDPALANTVAEQLHGLLQKYPVDTMEAYISMFNVNNVQGLREFIYVVVGIGVIIGFAVVCLSMYMAVLQRTREIGILKSLGGSKAFILRIILIEALALGLGGTVLGIAMSYGVYWAVRTFVPASIPMIIVYDWWWKACAITLIGTALGSLYPGLSAARHDPIEALAYE